MIFKARKTKADSTVYHFINSTWTWKFFLSLAFILFAQAPSSHAEFNKDADEVKGGDAVHVTGVQAVGATRIQDADVAGDKRIIHFVTPKGAATDKVILTANLTQDTPAIRAQVEWDGATEDPINPLKATISKAIAGKYPVVIKINGQAEKTILVWVVWGTWQPVQLNFDVIHINEKVGMFYDPVTKTQVPATAIVAGYHFYVDIAPHAIFDDPDRPKFEGKNSTVPPGTAAFCNNDLSKGAAQHWDMSRKVRQKVTVPNGWTAAGWGFDSCQYINLLNYPPGAEGNDDTFQEDEYIWPLGNGPGRNQMVGIDFLHLLYSIDRPGNAVRHAFGNLNDVIEIKSQWQEFARLEIGGVWYVISDLRAWRFHTYLKKISISEADFNVDLNGNGVKTDTVTGWRNNPDKLSELAFDNENW